MKKSEKSNTNNNSGNAIPRYSLQPAANEKLNHSAVLVASKELKFHRTIYQSKEQRIRSKKN